MTAAGLGRVTADDNATELWRRQDPLVVLVVDAAGVRALAAGLGDGYGVLLR
jgi:hypothetical protein